MRKVFAIATLLLPLLAAQGRSATAANDDAPSVPFIINHMFAAAQRQNSYHEHGYSVAGYRGQRGHVTFDLDVMLKPFRERILTGSDIVGAKSLSLDLLLGTRSALRQSSGRWRCGTSGRIRPVTGFFTESWRPWLAQHAHLVGPTQIEGEAVCHLRAPANIAGWQSSGKNVVTSQLDVYVAHTGFTLRRIRSVARMRGPDFRDVHHDGVDWTRYGEPVRVTLPPACRG